MDPRNKTIACANGLNTEDGDEFVNSDDNFDERILEWDEDQVSQDFDTPLSDDGKITTTMLRSQSAEQPLYPRVCLSILRPRGPSFLASQSPRKRQKISLVGSRKIKSTPLSSTLYTHGERRARANTSQGPTWRCARCRCGDLARHPISWRLCL